MGAGEGVPGSLPPPPPPAAGCTQLHAPTSGPAVTPSVQGSKRP